MEHSKKNWLTPEVKVMDIKTSTKQGPGNPPDFPGGPDVCDNPPCS